MLNCPICSADLGESRSGERRCPSCGSLLAWSEDASRVPKPPAADDAALDDAVNQDSVARLRATLAAVIRRAGRRDTDDQDLGNTLYQDQFVEPYSAPTDTPPSAPPPATQPPASRPTTPVVPPAASRSTLDMVRPLITVSERELSSDVVEKMTSHWGGMQTPAVSPRMTIKGAGDGRPQTTKSHLVVKARAVSDADEPQAEGADYQLLNLIGEGGVGVVFEARQASIDRTVAIKMLKSDFAGDDEHRRKFLSEAVVTGDLDHPNIVPIHDLGTNDSGDLFYAMKRVRGTPWLEVIRKSPLDDDLGILMNVADAVAFAHSRGVIHRDLKPENVMLGGFGEVLVMDWGLALSTPEFHKSGSITQTSSMGGTPAYMAPEMATGPMERIGPASDVYLLGAILYEIITGKPPHTGKDVMACLFAAARNLIQPAELPAGQAGELMGIAMKAMATAPEDRYPDVQTFQAAIRQFQSNSESLVLADNAEKDLAQAERTSDYQDYARALFGYEEALALWEGNSRAKPGLVQVRQAYAACAMGKGDLDLAASLLTDDPAHADLRRRIAASQRERDLRQQRLKRVRQTVLGLAAALFVVVTAALVVSTNFYRKAEDARRTADQQRKAAEEQKDLVESQNQLIQGQNQQLEQQNEVVAGQKQALEKQFGELQVEKERSDAARREADQAKAAEEAEAYVAQIGLASAKIDENAARFAFDLLGECQPAMRHWEWGRLMHLCRQENLTFDSTARIDAVAFAPDGERFALAGWGGTTVVWDARTASRLVTVEHGGNVYALAFSPDDGGRRLLTAGDDPAGAEIKLWDAASGTLLASLDAHEGAVLSAVFSRDGRRLLSASLDKTARLFDLESGQEVRPALRGHQGAVWSAAFSPDEQSVVTASEDQTAIIWSLADTQDEWPLPTFTGHEGPVYAAAFSPDGQTVATAGEDKRVLLWKPDQVQAVDFDMLVAERRGGPAPEFRALEGHTAAVRAVAFSPDGRFLLSGSHDNTVKMWDQESGGLLKTLRGHAGWVRACVFSPDGRQVLSGGYDQQACLWDTAAYEETRVLGTPGGSPVLAAAFSPDGKRVATAYQDGTARTWDFATGGPLVTFAEGHAFLGESVMYFPDGMRVLTGARDKSVRIWDAARGTQLARLDGTGRTAQGVVMAISHDGRLVLTGSDTAGAQLWDAADGQLLRRIPEQGGGVTNVSTAGTPSLVTTVAFSSDDRLMFTGHEDGLGQLWEVETGRLARGLTGHAGKIVAARFLPGDKRLVTASSDNTVAQWDLDRGRELTKLSLSHPHAVTALDVSPDGKLALTAAADGLARLWDLSRAALVRQLPVAGEASCVAFAPDGRRALTVSHQERALQLWDVASGEEIAGPGGRRPFVRLEEAAGGVIWSACFSPDGSQILSIGGRQARLWNVATGRVRASFSPHGVVSSTCFAPDGERIVTGSWDNSAKIWNARTGLAELRLAGGHTGNVNSVVFSPDGALVLSASDDGTARLWNAATGQAAGTLTGHSGPVRAAAFSPDGRLALTASDDGTARIWDVDSRTQVQELAGHELAVLCAVFSADGRLVMTGSEDHTARIWDAESGELLIELEGHTASVTSVAFSPDAQRALTGSADKTAKLWELRDWKEILTLKGHSKEITSVAFSPDDGRYVLTGSRDGTAIVWLAVDWHGDAAADPQLTLTPPASADRGRR